MALSGSAYFLPPAAVSLASNSRPATFHPAWLAASSAAWATVVVLGVGMWTMMWADPAFTLRRMATLEGKVGVSVVRIMVHSRLGSTLLQKLP